MKSRLSWLAIKATSIESKWKKFAFINHRENRWQSLTNYRAIRQKMTVKGRWSWRAPVVKHEKPACPRETGPRKGEEKRKTGGGPRLRPRTLDFSAKEILFWDEGRRLVYQGSRGRARAHAYQSSCSRTNQQQQEIKERVNRAWKENRKGGRLLESLRLETSSVFDREPWAVRSERNETRMSLKVFLH